MSENPEIYVPGGTVTDDEIEKMSEKVMQEAQRQGLPWWSGIFNPEIVKAAFKDMPEQDEKAKQRETQFEQDMNDLRAIQKERDRIMLEADKTVLDAIQCAAEMMKNLREEEEEKDDAAMGAADLGRAIAAMRESMNQKHYPISYCGVA